MPTRAPKLCSCGRVVPPGQRCEHVIVADRARKARHDARRPSARERGYDGAWQKARSGFLAHHPRCRRCSAPATVVDHVRPHRGDRKLFWDRLNWQSLCVTCHARHKQALECRGIDP